MLDSETTKTYTRPISKAWWLRDRGHFNCRYFMFLIRELTGIRRPVRRLYRRTFSFNKGPEHRLRFRESLRSGPFIVSLALLSPFIIAGHRLGYDQMRRLERGQ